GLGVAGVDILPSRRGPLVLEVNSSPGLEGIEAASGVDVASAIFSLAEAGAGDRVRGRTRRPARAAGSNLRVKPISRLLHTPRPGLPGPVQPSARLVRVVSADLRQSGQ